MKIIYLHQYFNTPRMSGGTRSYEMARRLVAAGHEVHMITSRRDNHIKDKGWKKEIIDGINVYWINVPYSNKMSFLKRIIAFIRFSVAAGLKAANVKGDILFATSTPLTIALPGVFASKILRIPMVFEVRDLWPEIPIAIGILKPPILKKMAYVLEKFAYKNSKHIVALSLGMKEGVVKTGYPESGVDIIPNSCDMTLFDSSNKDVSYLKENYPELSGKPLVVYTGTMGLINGVSYLPMIALSAMEEGYDINFAVFGTGLEEDKVRNKGFELGVLGKNFFIYPPVPKKEVPNILAGADLSLSLVVNIKQLWANSANKFFDSLAAGKPIAINYGGWQADLIKKENCGLVLPVEDSEKSAEMINRFINNKERLIEAGYNAKKLAYAEFDRDILADKLEDILKKALPKRL